MSGSIFYRFRSQKEASRLVFDGLGLSVFDLKREIIIQNKLGDGNDFDLVVVAEDGGEVYDDDTTFIPRSTAVVARRKPAMRIGRGSAARYVSGNMPQLARKGQHWSSQSHGSGVSEAKTNNVPKNLSHTEDDAIANVLKIGAADWAHQQQILAGATPVARPNGSRVKSSQNVPDHPPPPGYICYRCREKGHWIMECPTNEDPTFDGKPRIKRTTGIPKSFLKTVDKPVTSGSDDATEISSQPFGVMVNAEGEWVIAEPDQAAWERYKSQNQGSLTTKISQKSGDPILQSQGLECPIDQCLFVDPFKTPCCSKTYCHECIQNSLLDNDLRCPNCQTADISLDDLKKDDHTAARIRDWQKQASPQTIAMDVTQDGEADLQRSDASKANTLSNTEGEEGPNDTKRKRSKSNEREPSRKLARSDP